MKNILFFLYLFCYSFSFSQSISFDDSKTYAVVVGISDYQDEAIPDLQYADRDAMAFAEFLRSPAGGGLDDDHLKLLTNENATAAQIFRALDWLTEVSGENDKAIIYFSGHGDVESKLFSQPGFLLCWDSPSEVYAAGAVALPMFQLIVSTLSIEKKSKVVVITDACRAGKLAGSDVNGSNLTSHNLARQFANEIKILSCQPDEYSIEGEQWGGGRGAFSYHLVDGLYGMADQNQDQMINLMELNRYLQDKVSSEVAPLSQYPMTVGSPKAELASVNNEVLQQVIQKQNQSPVFASTSSKGIEDQVLSLLDSETRTKYIAFKQAIEENQFFEPETACAEYYYNKLIDHPGLAKLHSTMRRNYAAALQDDAQQVMNKFLVADPTVCLSLSETSRKKYQHYSGYLERAAELLGDDHYMYSTIMARKYWFESYILDLASNKDSLQVQQVLRGYKKSLELNPGMAQAYLKIGDLYALSLNNRDSAEHYFNIANKLSPKWVLPYKYRAQNFYENGQLDSAEYYIDMAYELDSNSTVVITTKAYIANDQNKRKTAIQFFEKAIQNSTDEIPCIYSGLANAYKASFQYEKAELNYLKTLELDSNFALGCVANLTEIYIEWNQYDQAEKMIDLLIRVLPSNQWAYQISGFRTLNMDDFVKAEEYFKKAISLFPESPVLHTDLVYHYLEKGDMEKALESAVKADKKFPEDPNVLVAYNYYYTVIGERELAKKALKKAVELNYYLSINYLGRRFRTVALNKESGTMVSHIDQLFTNLLEVLPHNKDVHYEYARNLAIRKQNDKALQELEKALQLGYDNIDSIQNMGEFRYVLQQMEWEKMKNKYLSKQ